MLENKAISELKKERENLSFTLNEVLNEKNLLQRKFNEETNPLRPLTPEEEKQHAKTVKRNRWSLLLCMIVSFALFGFAIHLATFGMLYQVEIAIVSGLAMPFFFYGVVIFFFCEFKSFSQLDYEHEHQQKEKPIRIRHRKLTPKAIELKAQINQKVIEYNTLYDKLMAIDQKIKELEK